LPLLERIDGIRLSAAVILAAGMDAALVSVVGGLVSSVVIALPTSVDYGVADGGGTAIKAALASCAPGIAVSTSTWLRRGLRILANMARHSGPKRSMERTGRFVVVFELGEMNTEASLYSL
jgi:hypothetical protein